KFNPTGGVTRPISSNNTRTTPNQIGSKPNSTINGNTIGRVINKDAIMSKNNPKIKYITIIKNKIVYTDKPLATITSTIRTPTLVVAIKLAKILAPITIKKIIDVCLAVVINESYIVFIFNFLIINPIAKAPNAPNAATSVDVATPKYNREITNIISNTAGTTLFRDENLSPHVDASTVFLFLNDTIII